MLLNRAYFLIEVSRAYFYFFDPQQYDLVSFLLNNISFLTAFPDYLRRLV